MCSSFLQNPELKGSFIQSLQKNMNNAIKQNLSKLENCCGNVLAEIDFDKDVKLDYHDPVILLVIKNGLQS